MTLVIYNDLSCDILPSTVINETEMKVNTNLIGTFKSFLGDVCNGVTFSEVIRKYIEVQTSVSK